MNFEAIETAFELLLENVQTIENDLGTHAYDLYHCSYIESYRRRLKRCI